MMIEGRRLRLLSGREVLLPRDMTDFRIDGDIYIVKSPTLGGLERVTASRKDQGTAVWSITKKPTAVCSLDQSQLELTLPSGVFVAERPISDVVQSDRIFVVCTADRAGGPLSPVIGVAENGSVLWNLPANYYTINYSPTSGTVFAVRPLIGETVDVLTGTIIGSEQIK
jgi:hypothetical protein